VQLHHKNEKKKEKKKKESWAYFVQKACSTGSCWQAYVAELNWAPKAYTLKVTLHLV
jgi:hypothetical protein